MILISCNSLCNTRQVLFKIQAKGLGVRFVVDKGKNPGVIYNIDYMIV